MKISLNVLSEEPPTKDSWDALNSIWPKLKANELISGTPIHPQEKVRYVTRKRRYLSENSLPALQDSMHNLRTFGDTNREYSFQTIGK